MYRYFDRDGHGQIASAHAAERVLLEEIESDRVDPDFVTQYSTTLAEARQKFLKKKSRELRECLHEARLIQMSIDQMLVKQPGEQ